MLHTGKSADYVNLSLKSGAVWLVINLGSGAFEALVEPVNGKFNDNAWHDVRVTRNLRQVNTALVIQGHHSRCGASVCHPHYLCCIIWLFTSFLLGNEQGALHLISLLSCCLLPTLQLTLRFFFFQVAVEEKGLALSLASYFFFSKMTKGPFHLHINISYNIHHNGIKDKYAHLRCYQVHCICSVINEQVKKMLHSVC